MKKLHFLLLLFLCCRANAATHIVSVSNFQFTPSNLNVVVGDVIRWEWQSGFHTTTSATIPVAANPWGSGFLSASGDFFEYTVLVEGAYEYYCDVHGVSMSGSFTASGVVPVTLSAFQVRSNHATPLLSWITEAESNVDYFAVRRSYDGAIFTEVARIPAAGNSSSSINYQYTDLGVNAKAKFVYYELAIVDRNNRIQLSPITMLRNNEASKKIIISLSPNPVSVAGHLLLQFNADATDRMQAVISDMSGKVMMHTQLYASPGVNNGHIHLAALPAGNYVIQFTLNGVVETYKIRKE